MSERKEKIIKFFRKSDDRGDLIPIESNKDIPFQIERVFYIKNMDSYPRGFHAHRKSIQILIPICGSFDIELDNGNDRKTYHLEKDNEGLLIPLYTWLKMFNFSKDCVIMVICSYKYDEEEYIRNYGDFIKEINNE